MRARLRKNIIKDTRAIESVANIRIHAAQQAGFNRSTQWTRLNIPQEFFELAVNHKVKQRFPVRKMMIDSHRRNAHSLRHTPHAHGILTLRLQNFECLFRNAFGSRRFLHSYTLYTKLLYTV